MPTMTLEEFLNKVPWDKMQVLSVNGFIRAKTGDYYNSCPINMAGGHWQERGGKLGLDDKLVDDIMYAADNLGLENPRIAGIRANMLSRIADTHAL